MPENARRTALAALTGLTLLGAGATFAEPAAASSADSSGLSTTFRVTPDGVIHYPSRLARAGIPATLTRVAGQRDGAGNCVVQGGAKGRAGAPATFSEQVAFTPSTCASVVASATPTPQQLRTLSPSGVTSSTSAAGALAAPPAGAPDGTGVVAVTTYSRWVRTAWVDPISIDISSQKVGLKWTSTNWANWGFWRDSFKGCVSGVCLDKTYIVSGSNGLTGITNGWQEKADVHFRNTSFALWVVAVLGPTGWAACGFPTSNQADFYHSDTVKGYRDGGAAWTWSDNKSGACTNLVHHEDSTGTSW